MSTEGVPAGGPAGMFFEAGDDQMSGQVPRMKSHAKLRANIQSWLIMLPGLLLMTFFVWEPLFESIRMSLYKTRNVELVRFIGFDNFISVTGKDDFLQALFNTFSYTFWFDDQTISEVTFGEETVNPQELFIENETKAFTRYIVCASEEANVQIDDVRISEYGIVPEPACLALLALVAAAFLRRK